MYSPGVFLAFSALTALVSATPTPVGSAAGCQVSKSPFQIVEVQQRDNHVATIQNYSFQQQIVKGEIQPNLITNVVLFDMPSTATNCQLWARFGPDLKVVEDLPYGESLVARINVTYIDVGITKLDLTNLPASVFAFGGDDLGAFDLIAYSNQFVSTVPCPESGGALILEFGFDDNFPVSASATFEQTVSTEGLFIQFNNC
ncbi:hypothetical protein B7463_g10426, partial [Scytalidium lignicola]